MKIKKGSHLDLKMFSIFSDIRLFIPTMPVKVEFTAILRVLSNAGGGELKQNDAIQVINPNMA